MKSRFSEDTFIGLVWVGLYVGVGFIGGERKGVNLGFGFVFFEGVVVFRV